MDETYEVYRNSKDFMLWPLPEAKFLDVLYGRDDTNNKTKVFKEEVDGQLVGFISVKSKTIEGEKNGSIVFIFVGDKCQNQEIGHKLMQAGISWFKSQKNILTQS